MLAREEEPMGYFPWRAPRSRTARKMEDEIQQEVFEIQVREGVREEEQRREALRNHPGFLRRLFPRRSR
jgi:hypothetical protein